MIWSDGTNNVHIPPVVQPVAPAAPAEVSGTGDPINYNVTFGYTGSTGTIDLTFIGLAPGTKYLGSVIYSDSVNPLPTSPTIVSMDTP